MFHLTRTGLYRFSFTFECLQVLLDCLTVKTQDCFTHVSSKMWRPKRAILHLNNPSHETCIFPSRLEEFLRPVRLGHAPSNIEAVDSIDIRTGSAAQVEVQPKRTGPRTSSLCSDELPCLRGQSPWMEVNSIPKSNLPDPHS